MTDKEPVEIYPWYSNRNGAELRVDQVKGGWVYYVIWRGATTTEDMSEIGTAIRMPLHTFRVALYEHGMKPSEIAAPLYRAREHE